MKVLTRAAGPGMKFDEILSPHCAPHRVAAIQSERHGERFTVVVQMSAVATRWRPTLLYSTVTAGSALPYIPVLYRYSSPQYCTVQYSQVTLC